MSTLTAKADPVTRGAVEIQATTFNIAAGEYARWSQEEAQKYVKDNGGGKTFLTFPLSEKVDPSLKFFRRKDMPVADSALATIGCYRVTKFQTSVPMPNPTTLVRMNVPVEVTLAYVTLWHPFVLSLTGGASGPCVLPVGFWAGLLRDPETGSYLLATDHWHYGTEAVGLLTIQAAGIDPSLDRMLQVAGGDFPIA
jgi:hypothetical protein